MTTTNEPGAPNTASVQHRTRRPVPLLSVAALAIVIAGTAVGIALWHRRGSDPFQQAKQRTEQRRQAEQETAKAQDQERIAMAKRMCQQAIDQGQKTLDLIAEFDKELKEWDDNVVVLLTNDRGKALAATPAHIQAFRNHFQQRRPTKADGEAIRTHVLTLLEPVRAALAAEQTTYKPSPEFLAALENEGASTIRLIEQCRKPRLNIQGLVVEAQRTGKHRDITLEQAIRELDAQHADEQARTIAKDTDAARTEADRRLAAARADKIRQEAEDHEKQIKAEKDLEAARSKSKREETAASREAEEKRGVAEAARIREDAEKKVKMQRAQSAEVKTLLAPLTAEGYWQPGVDAKDSTDKKPISLSKLRGYGALEDSPGGLQKLLTVGTQPYWNYLQDKVRPRWPWHPDLKQIKPDQLEQLKLAQKYLRELDTVLVELKMLSD